MEHLVGARVCVLNIQPCNITLPLTEALGCYSHLAEKFTDINPLTWDPQLLGGGAKIKTQVNVGFGPFILLYFLVGLPL